MPRPKAFTPAARIREIVAFFSTAPVDIAEIAFELARAALNDRKIAKVKRREASSGTQPVRLSRVDEAREELQAGMTPATPTPVAAPAPPAPPAIPEPTKKQAAPVRKRGRRKQVGKKRRAASAVEALPPQTRPDEQAEPGEPGAFIPDEW